jgi:hypothetical protein
MAKLRTQYALVRYGTRTEIRAHAGNRMELGDKVWCYSSEYFMSRAMSWMLSTFDDVAEMALDHAR